MPTLYFLYHEIRPATSGYAYAIDLKEFEAQTEFLAANTRNARQEAEPVCPLVKSAITFDDGHRSDYEYALPALERLGLSAHFFITAGWTGERAGYMNWPELLALHRAGQQVGAHGWSHILLTHCGRDELQRELGDSRRRLEDGLGAAVTTLSLPGGRYNRRVLAACREAGYERIFTSEPRVEHSPPVGLLTGRVNLLASSNVSQLRDMLAPQSKKLAALQKRYRIKRIVNTLLGDSLYAKVWAVANGRQAEGEPAREAEV